MKFKITIFKENQIIKVKTFDNRIDAEQFIREFNAEPKPYKPVKNKIYHTMEV